MTAVQPNKGRKQTKLKSAPERRAEVPPCAPAGEMDGGTASQLVRRVRRTPESSIRHVPAAAIGGQSHACGYFEEWTAAEPCVSGKAVVPLEYREGPPPVVSPEYGRSPTMWLLGQRDGFPPSPFRSSLRSLGLFHSGKSIALS
jgi:hypothetical protein